MLNENLFSNQDEISFAKLKLENSKLKEEIEAFKAYDNKRKAYYARAMMRLGELESYLDEISETNKNIKRNFNRKMQIKMLEIEVKKLKEKLNEV
jgi:hypothetical protein